MAGTTFGGRHGDKNPWSRVIPAALLTTALLAAITLSATNSIVAVAPDWDERRA
ncbi:hypothetical protein [Streptomyces sp. NPDC055134]